ncbi:MAG: LysM peptidoglycan-binding domain-containing protein [Jatrophihabitans sp.]|uniref:LysM peptidoglycan-binding domain-containing protein n=1 Tax=Jatrophihabitans sp. TaxID=1932789 RepID=UPI003915FC3E
MSVATELVPTVSIPDRARPYVLAPPPERLATVTALRPPRDAAGLAPVRLTRRGVVVLALVVLAVASGLVWLAAASAPRAATPSAPPRAVTVQAGDTLWSIATRVAPQRDPRAEVAALQKRNGLTDVELVPGQVLRVP